MNRLVAHRGPDDEDYYFTSNLALGHRRLAILDLSADGRQPMTRPGTGLTITYNGEIYNYRELREELKGYGHCFYTQTDTEVILAAYQQWGRNCVERFNGMWAFALFDSHNQTVFCSRDRFGIKPFYYAALDDLFLFGSEIKQFGAVPGWRYQMNAERALDFLRYGVFDQGEETLFEGVNQLRGGHQLIYDLKHHRRHIERWYHLESRLISVADSEAEVLAKFKDRLTDAVDLRLRSDVKVGSCLSGGLDSSTIVCLIHQILNQMGTTASQETVSSCSQHEEFDERPYIDRVVRATGVINHQVFPSFEDLFPTLETLLWHQEEPFGSTSIYAQWHVFAEAKQKGLTVMLDGQGADEQLAGYHGFFGPHLARLFRSGKWASLIGEGSQLRRLHGCGYSKSALQMVKSLLPASFWSFLVKGQVPKWILPSSTPDSFCPPRPWSLRSLSLAQILESHLPMLLHHEDRNAMAHSVEARVPFMDHRLVEWVVSLGDRFKIRHGQTKWVLRRALNGTVPGEVLSRHDKMGFVTPESLWARNHSRAFERAFSEGCQSLTEFVEPSGALAYCKGTLAAPQPDIKLLWRVICLATWKKVFNL